MNKIISLVITIIKKYFTKLLVTIFPAKIISTIFGIGYLPEWQAHFASLFIIPIAVLISYLFTWFEGSIVDLSLPLVITAILFFPIGIFAIRTFQISHSSADDEIMIHVAFGQIVVLALSGPAVISIGNNIVEWNDVLCEKFLYCAPWFYKTITYVPILAVPYFTYRLVDTFKPWPASILDRDYNTGLSNMTEGLINALYTVLFLYLVAFILLDLTMDEALIFFDGISDALFPYFYVTKQSVVEQLKEVGLADVIANATDTIQPYSNPK